MKTFDKKSDTKSRTQLRKNFPFVLIKLLLFFILILTGDITMAQNSNSEEKPKSEVVLSKEVKEKIQKLNEEKEIQKIKTEIAENKKKEAESLKETLKAKLPSSETKGLEGTVTINPKAGYYSEILAYEALQNCSKKIADTIASKLNKNDELIIIGQANLAEEAILWNLLDLKISDKNKEIEELLEKYKDYDPNSPSEGIFETLIVTPAILSAVADITAFFKTDRTIVYKEVQLNENALMAAVAKEIRLKTEDKNIKMFLPNHDLTGEGGLINKLNHLMEKRSELYQLRIKLSNKFKDGSKNKKDRLLKEKNELEKELDQVKNDSQKVKKLQEELENKKQSLSNLSLVESMLEEITTLLDQEIKAANDLIFAITEKQPDSLSPLERVAGIEKIKNHQEAKILQLFIVSQAGEILTSRSSFLNTKIYYSGGAIISYFLTEQNGSYLISDIERQFKRTKQKRTGEY